MKILYALTIGVCLVGLSAIPALAQTGSKAGFEVGVSGSRISPTASGQSVSMRPGLLVGVYGGAQIIKTVGLQVEAIYAQKRSQLTRGTRVDDLNLDYLEIPILAKMSLFKGLYVLEGVALGFPIRARLTPASGAAQDIKSHTTSPDIGMVIGVVVPAGRMGIEGRYNGGFKKIDDAAGAATQRNRSFSAIVRVPF